MPWKPTYDRFDSKEAAVKDAARRNTQAKGSRKFAVKKTGSGFTVMYKEGAAK